MQKYSLYFLKDEFVNHYYHKSDILYHFFRKYQVLHDNVSYQKQFDFITKEIPTTEIISFLKKHHNLSIHKNESTMEIHDPYTSLKIDCKQREWIVYCPSIHIAETLLFEQLRSYHSSFFVLNVDEDQYGWLAPVRKELIL
jgi:hypothetical protein